MGRYETKKTPKCAYEECENEVDDGDFCYGCGHYICDEHSLCDPWGSHDPEEHWNVCEKCGEHIDACIC